jgi:hypothetical protein
MVTGRVYHQPVPDCDGPSSENLLRDPVAALPLCSDARGALRSGC